MSGAEKAEAPRCGAPRTVSGEEGTAVAISVRLSVETMSRLDDLSVSRGVSRSGIIRDAIGNHLAALGAAAPTGKPNAPRYATTVRADGTVIHTRCGRVTGTIRRHPDYARAWLAQPAGRDPKIVGSRGLAIGTVVGAHLDSGCEVQAAAAS